MKTATDRHTHAAPWRGAALRSAILLAGAALAPGAALATPVHRPPAVIARLLGARRIQAVQRLPTAGGIMAVKAGGKVYIMSNNGRYLFDGTLRDVWHNGRALSTMREIKRTATHVDLDAIGVDFSQLVTVTMGQGEQTVTAFVSPRCAACRQALGQLRALGKHYRTRVVVVPAPGRAAVQATRRIACAKDRAHALALVLHPDDKLGAACAGAQAKLANTLISARMIGVDTVPFLIAPDGRLSKGLPRHGSIADFLQGKEHAR